jgi:hypothetical protein
MNRTDMAQNRDEWRALVKAVLISGFYNMREISWLVEKLLAFWQVRFRRVLIRSYLEIRVHITYILRQQLS